MSCIIKNTAKQYVWSLKSKARASMKTKPVTKNPGIATVVLLCLCLCVLPVLLGAVAKETAYAAPLASGESGTVDWEISAEGVLTLTPKEGASEGTLASLRTDIRYDRFDQAPWYDYRKSITAFVIPEGKTIKAGASIGYMFYGFTSLTYLDLTGLDVSGATSIRGLVSGCSNLSAIDFGGIDTSRVTNFEGVFAGCSSLSLINAAAINTSSATTMESMFKECSALTSLDLTGFDTSQVTTMDEMFRGCSVLASLTITQFNTSNVTSMVSMFEDCPKLTSLDLANFNTTKVTNMNYMFDGAQGLVSLNISSFDTINTTSMAGMFAGCASLQTLSFPSTFTVQNVSRLSFMFEGCASLTSLDLSGFSTSKATELNYMFSDCSNLQSVNLSNIDTTSVTRMQNMFEGCASLTSLDLSNFNTSKVTRMEYMFAGCSLLVSPNLSSFDITKVEQVNNMFEGCSSLASIDLTNFSSSNASLNVRDMFRNAYLVSVSIGEATHTEIKDQVPLPPKDYQLDLALDLLTTGKWIDKDKVAYESLAAAPAGEFSAQLDGTLNLNSSTVTFSIDPSAATYSGEEIKPAVTVKNGDRLLTEGTHYTAVYSNNVSAATSSAANAPTVTITGVNNCEGTRSLTFDINPLPVDGATIDAIASQTYNGQPYTPSSTVTLDGVTLETPRDYTTAYLDAGGAPVASPTDAGTYSFTITGVGNYTGTKSVIFTIDQAAVDTASIAVIPNRAYNTQPYTPSPTVMLSGATLETPRDYTIEYFDAVDAPVASPTEAGTYRLKITGVGNYTGTQTVSFTIDQAAVDAASIAAIPNRAYNTQPYTPSPAVALDGVTLETPRDYTIEYFDAANAPVASPTVAGAYSLKITGAGNYTGTQTVSFTIDQAAVSGATVAAIASYTYNDRPYTPSPAVVLDGVTLETPRDYTIEYLDAANAPVSSPTEAGTYRLKITGVGNYTGTQTVSFTIDPLSIQPAVVIHIPNHLFDDKPYAPIPTVVLDHTTLQTPRDFTYEYLDATGTSVTSPTSAGIYSVRITGTGNYTSVISTSFIIDPLSLETAVVSGVSDAAYTTQSYTPVPVVTLNGVALESPRDFTVEYFDATDTAVASPTTVGTYTAKIVGTGNYTGIATQSVDFTITIASLDAAQIAPIQNHTYDSKSYTPSPTVTLNGQALETPRDYTVEYFNAAGEAVTSPVDIGTYTVKITGVENCEGSTSATFQIVEAPVAPEDPSNSTSGSGNGKTLPGTGDNNAPIVALLGLSAVMSLVLVRVSRKAA